MAERQASWYLELVNKSSRYTSTFATISGDDQLNVTANAAVRKRQIAATLVIVAASLLWIVSLLLTGRETTLPWCLSLAAVTALQTGWLLRELKRTEYATIKIGGNQPVSTIETCAGTYAILSVSLCTWILCHFLYMPEPVVIKPQVVDIELTSLDDYRDRHQLLPSTPELPTLRERTSPDKVTVHGSVGAGNSFTKLNSSKPPKTISTASALPAIPSPKSLRPATDHVNVAKSQPDRFIVNVQSTASPASTPVRHTTDKGAYQDNRPLMEEVAPPELIELVNNDGDHTLNLWQPGGRSDKGAGAHSNLTEYLKELNRRIKAAWFPPTGDTHKVEILFRIKHSGQLASVQLLTSSGDSDSDRSALQAITSSAPFKQLPSDYSLNYIDIRYSFHYSVDQLSEVTNVTR